jgi:hypothetical protein
LRKRCPDAKSTAAFHRVYGPKANLLAQTCASSCLKNKTPKGGRVRFREYGCPWKGIGEASTPPRLP